MSGTRNTEPDRTESVDESGSPMTERAETDIERAVDRSGGTGLDRDETDERAAGTVEDPIQPDAGQAGDLNEEAARRGGPVDISPARERHGGS